MFCSRVRLTDAGALRTARRRARDQNVDVHAGHGEAGDADHFIHLTVKARIPVGMMVAKPAPSPRLGQVPSKNGASLWMAAITPRLRISSFFVMAPAGDGDIVLLC